MESTMAANSGGTASILRLPLEIMTMICRELADTRSLARLAQTCRTLNSTIVPILYTEIRDSHRSPLRVAALALSLAASPARAQYIRSIKFFRPYVVQDSQTPSEAVTTWEFEKTVGQHLFADTPPFLWNSNLATMMAVASLAPNLSSIEMAAASGWSDTDFMLERTTHRRVIGSRPTCTLHNLTKLVVHCPRGGINLDKLRGLLHSTPNLQFLEIERPRGGTSLTARLTNLTTLSLVESFLCHRGLKHLLRGCTSLTHFEYRHYNNGWSERYLPVSPAQVIECLEPCKSTLQKLYLAPFVYGLPWPSQGWPAVFQKPYPLLTSLDGFSALKQFSVDSRGIERARGGSEVLARMLLDCAALEGFFLMGVEEFPGREFACFTRAVVDEYRW